MNADSESPPHDVGLKCFPDKLLAKKLHRSRDITWHGHLREKVKFLVSVRVLVVVWVMVVYKIPYRRARAWPLGLLAFRPSASREQRYLAYKGYGCGYGKGQSRVLGV